MYLNNIFENINYLKFNTIMYYNSLFRDKFDNNISHIINLYNFFAAYIQCYEFDLRIRIYLNIAILWDKDELSVMT